MEAGDYPTNVLSINDLSSIHYHYLEPVPSRSYNLPSVLRNIESSWRSEGALVVCDPSKVGLWLFGMKNNAGPDSLLPTSAVVDVTGTIEAQGISMVTKIKGTYDPGSLAKTKASLQAAANSQNQTPQSASLMESPFRLMQNGGRTPQISPTPAPNLDPSTLSIYKVENGPSELSPAPLPREMHERFISAVLASLVYRLSSHYGYIGLNSRTLLAPSPLGTNINSEPPNSSFDTPNSKYEQLLVTLDVYLTSLGNLILKASSRSTSSLASAVAVSEGSGSTISLREGKTIWLAPGGTVAQYIGPEESLLTSTDVDTPVSGETRQRLPAGDALEDWKTQCRTWLTLHGLHVNKLEAEGWLLVQIPRQQLQTPGSETVSSQSQGRQPSSMIIAWPALLCFHRTIAASSNDFLEKTNGLSSMNDALSMSCQDPLEFAEEWLSGNSDREILIKKRQKEREIAEAAAVKEQNDAEAKTFAANTYSPVALRRPSIAGGVYPTPPDGILNPVGATPSFDGNVSTPGNANALVAPTHEQTPAAIPKDGGDDNDADLWGPPSTKPDQVGSQYNDNDDIFPDLNGDLFGDAAVTDADFSFFDEPDDADTAAPPPAIHVDDGEQMIAHDTERSELSKMDFSDEKDKEAILHLQAEADAMDISVPPSNAPSASAMDTGKPETQAEEQPAEVLSPLNPNTLKKRLFANSPWKVEADAMSIDGSEPDTRRQRSAFGSVAFSRGIVSVNAKYGSGGRFDFTLPPKAAKRPATIAIPQTEYLTRRLHRKSELHTSFKQVQAPEKHDDYDETASQSDAESDESYVTTQSDQDDSSQTVDSFRPLNSAGLKRRRADDGDDDVLFNSQDFTLERSKLNEIAELSPTTPLFNPDPAEWSLADVFSRPEPPVTSTAIGDAEFMVTAQILTEQAVSTTIQIPGLAQDQHQIDTLKEDSLAHKIQKDFFSATKAYISDIFQCQLSSYLEIQDLIAQLSRLATRPMPNPPRPADLRPTIMSIPSPHLEVRRADSKLSVLPSAIAFWENLGLAAAKGGKDVKSVCVFFDSDGMAANASVFLDRVASSYESCRLGSHSRLSVNDLDNGLMPIDTANAVQNSVLGRQVVLSSTKETAARLGMILSAAPLTNTNVVVYLVYPSTDSELLVHICYAFQHLFEVYKSSMREKKTKPTIELVLQLVPQDFVASRTTLAVPEPSEYSNFAMQVYDRCTDFTSESFPCVTLEEPLPRGIEFKLTPNPSASLLQEGSCMHVAYAQSVDERWITAAWTDNVGRMQTTASYCLGRKGGPIVTSAASIAQEIWNTTIGIISCRRVTWRILITKVGAMERAELEFWKQLAAHETSAQVNLFVLTANTHPSLSLLPPTAALPPGVFAAQSGAYTTPVSTPQPSQTTFMSPDQSGAANTPTPTPTPTSSTAPTQSGAANAPTPGDGPVELEADATLTDVTETTWGCILSHRLNNSNSLLDFHPALVSGYLIKRSGAGTDDPPVVMEVNVVHTEANPRAFEPLLREVLVYFRGLNTLARVRNVVHAHKDVRPWHIAAAEKGVEALYLLM